MYINGNAKQSCGSMYPPGEKAIASEKKSGKALNARENMLRLSPGSERDRRKRSYAFLRVRTHKSNRLIRAAGLG